MNVDKTTILCQRDSLSLLATFAGVDCKLGRHSHNPIMAELASGKL